LITNLPLSNFHWTAQGTTISNFFISTDAYITNGYPVSLSATNNQNIEFYWMNGGIEQVLCSATMANGQKITGHALFNVKKPSGVITAYIPPPGTAEIYADTFSFGSSSFAGIEFFKNDLDTDEIYADGDWDFVQLGTQTFNFQEATNGQWYIETGTGLDTTYPYSSEGTDSPSTQVDPQYSQITGKGSCTMYLTYKPSGTNSIRVPIRQINWHWSGTATNNSGTWSATGSGYVDPNDSPAPTTISWTDNIARTLNTKIPQ
jgi:hypothetical protein